jgi:hypothetical protein
MGEHSSIRIGWGIRTTGMEDFLEMAVWQNVLGVQISSKS